MKRTANSKASKWKLSKQVAELRQFIGDPAQKRVSVEEPSSSVEDLLRTSDPILRRVMAKVTVSFGVIGGWWSTCGILRVADGDHQGWAEVRRGLQFHLFAAWLRHAWMKRENRWDKETVSSSILSDTESLTLCHAIATNEVESATKFGDRLLANLHDRSGGDKLYFYDVDLQPFSVWLYSIWKNRTADFRSDVERPLGQYDAIRDSWTDAERMCAALAEACDYHCHQCFDGGGQPMFVFPPYNVFPVELLALRQVRRDLDLPFPAIDHPLVQSVFCDVPMVPANGTEDPLLLETKAFVQSHFPELGDAW